MKKNYNLNYFESFFRDSKIVITGHNGFKGTWLSKILSMCGANVFGFSKKNTDKLNHFQLLNMKNVKNFYGDIRNFKSINHFLKKIEPDFVFHLAAQPLVSQSINNPVETFTTNIIGSMNLLESIRSINSIKSLVYITSDKCYENNEWVWGYRENDILGGKDPYSSSKASAELILSSYMRTFFDLSNIGVGSARAGNVIGGGDWSKDRLIPDCIKALNNNKKIIIRSPKSTRPWQHVLEPLSGYLLLSRNLYSNSKQYSGSWNFGPNTNNVKSVKEIVKMVIKANNFGKYEIKKNKLAQKEANILQLNCDKSKSYLKWKPKWNIDKTIKETVIWYKDIYNKKNIDNTTTKQIIDYFDF